MNNKRWTALPIFLAMSVAMLVMAIVDLKFSPTVAFIEILVSIVFFVVSLIFVLNFKSYVNSVVKSSESTINEVSDRYIDQIKTPAVVIGENDEIIIFNTIFKKTFFPLKSPVNENITTVKELIKIPSIKDLLQYRLQHVNVAGEPTVIINLSKEYPELNMLLKQTMAELRKTQLLKDFE